MLFNSDLKRQGKGEGWGIFVLVLIGMAIYHFSSGGDTSKNSFFDAPRKEVLRLDGTSEAAYRASQQRMCSVLTPSEIAELDVNLGFLGKMLAMDEFNNAPFGSMVDGLFDDSEKTMANVRMKLHGKTAQDINDMATARRKKSK